MASKRKLRGSFDSLSDTLAFRFDPGFPEDVSGRWLGAMTHTAGVGRRQKDWASLPAESDEFDPVVTDLVDAAHELAAADNTTSRLKALGQADAALDELGSVLDRAGNR